MRFDSDGPGPQALPSAASGNARSQCDALTSIRRIAVELIAAVLVAFLVSLLVQKVVAVMRLPNPSLSSVATALKAVAVAALVATLVVLALNVRSRFAYATSSVGCWVGISTLATLALALPLAGTRLYLGGIDVDQMFRTQYVTRFADSAQLADYNYADLPPFYPATWFWLGGRFADIVGLPGWAAYKPFAIATTAVAAVAAMVLWRVVVRRRIALLLALATTAAGIQATAVLNMKAGVVQPYSWLLAALLPPMTAIAWHVLHCARTSLRQHWPHLVLVGLYVGLCLAMYTLHAAFVTLLLIAMGVAAIITAGPRLPAARTTLLRLAIIGFIAACCALPVWWPYLSVAIPAGWPATSASDFLVPVTATLPTPMLEPLALGALCLAGTVWVPFAWGRSFIARSLGVLIIGVYVWYGLSALRLLTGTTLLPQRTSSLLVAALACGAVFAGREVVQAARARAMPSTASGTIRIVATLGVVTLVTAIQSVHRDLAGSIETAYTTYYPSGVTAQGNRDPSAHGAWVGQVADTIERFSAKPDDQTVVLSDTHALLAYFPYSGFQTPQPVYANPLVDYELRNTVATRWSSARTPQQLLSQLGHSPAPSPSVFVFTRESDGFHVTLQTNAFPRENNSPPRELVFAPQLFDTAYWHVRTVGPFTVVVRR